MALLDVLDVSPGRFEHERLWGASIDLPQAGSSVEAGALDVAGWVLGRDVPAIAVELDLCGATCRRAPIRERRPDVATALPSLSGAASCGFHTTISAAGTRAELELRVLAVLRDQTRIALGTIRARRRWRDGTAAGEDPLVSVVIPCYNQARFLGDAIESVLAQTYPHLEVLVVDDGSADNTQLIATRYPGVRCVRQPNQGPAAARNAGIRHTTGGYLVFLDADDRLMPGALEIGLQSLNRSPACALAIGHHQLIVSEGFPIPTAPPPVVEPDLYRQLLRGCFIPHPASLMFRRSVFDTVGGFDPSRHFAGAEDYELYLRVARHHALCYHGAVVAAYRRHATNSSRDPGRLLASTMAVLRSQRRHVSAHPRYAPAYRAGLASGRRVYGEALAEKLRADVRAGRGRVVLRDLVGLLRYYPRGIAALLRTA
jgi:glycosyltransferase involved in cell wall biosynthesis